MRTTQSPSPFFRAGCGCIGLDIGSTKGWVPVKRCDRDHDDHELELSAYMRCWSDQKDYQPLTEKQTEVLLQHLGRMIALGYRFTEVRHLFVGEIPDIEPLHKQLNEE